jgi:hypothetical protein
MKQRWYGVGALLAVLAALTLSAPALAAAKQVPFKARSSGVATTTGFDPVAMIASTRVEGQGQATYLGQFTATAVAEVDVVTGNAHGSWTLTAANGDQLFLTFTAVPSSDSTHGIGTFTIVGGTGRFAGATGFYEQIIEFADVPGTADATYTDVLTGMISF